MPKMGKTHYTESLLFDALVGAAFENIASVGAGVTAAAVQARLPMPFRCKVRGITATCTTIGTGGTHSVVVVRGTGAPGGTPAAEDTVAPANASIAAATLTAADTPVSGYAGNQDAIVAKGDLLTLRAVTPASTGAFTGLKVSLALVPVDDPGQDTTDPKVF